LDVKRDKNLFYRFDRDVPHGLLIGFLSTM
jgi:hypothetical protein